MRIGFAGHRMNETHVICMFPKVVDERRDHLARLTTGLEFPGTFLQRPLFTLEGDHLFCGRHGLVMHLHQLWLVVERIEMATSAGTEDHNNIFGFGWKMSFTNAVWVLRINLRTNRRLLLRRQQAITDQQIR